MSRHQTSSGCPVTSIRHSFPPRTPPPSFVQVSDRRLVDKVVGSTPGRGPGHFEVDHTLRLTRGPPHGWTVDCQPEHGDSCSRLCKTVSGNLVKKLNYRLVLNSTSLLLCVFFFFTLPGTTRVRSRSLRSSADVVRRLPHMVSPASHRPLPRSETERPERSGTVPKTFYSVGFSLRKGV